MLCVCNMHHYTITTQMPYHRHQPTDSHGVLHYITSPLSIYVPIAYPAGYEIAPPLITKEDERELLDVKLAATMPPSSLCDWVASILSNDNLRHVPNDIRPTLLVPTHFDQDGMLRQKGRVLAGIPSHAMQSHLWAAGFSFCRAKVCRTVLYSMLVVMYVVYGYLLFFRYTSVCMFSFLSKILLTTDHCKICSLGRRYPWRQGEEGEAITSIGGGVQFSHFSEV